MLLTQIRVAYVAPTQPVADAKIESIKRAFFSFNTTDFNAFKSQKANRNTFLKQYETASFDRPFSFSTEEFATIYHYPQPDTVPHIVHVVSRKKEPPDSLPKEGSLGVDELSVFGSTNYHNQNIPFGIKRVDRRRHLYVVGKSGTGKSKLLELLINADIQAGKGVAVLDPHGDLVDAVLKFVPEHRKNDVVIFDPGDLEYPIAFNPLEQVPQELKLRVTIGFVEIFKKLFGANWTPRLEHVLRYTTLALLDSPNTTLIRNIVGQPENRLNIREIMDSQKILLMKISKGKLGEENCGLIGAMMVTKIQQAAMARADTPEEQRKDFYLYCDEFQYFATDTFAEILSEARKYRLNLTMAHQYMGQLSDLVKTTVFGNVGSIINFRVGAEDAVILEKEYTPRFGVRDIINLGVREMYLKMSIDGEIKDAFSAKTLNVPDYPYDYTKEIIDLSRKQYARPLPEVERIMKAWNETGSAEDPNASLESGEEKFAAPIV